MNLKAINALLNQEEIGTFRAEFRQTTHARYHALVVTILCTSVSMKWKRNQYFCDKPDIILFTFFLARIIFY